MMNLYCCKAIFEGVPSTDRHLAPLHVSYFMVLYLIVMSKEMIKIDRMFLPVLCPKHLRSILLSRRGPQRSQGVGRMKQEEEGSTWFCLTTFQCENVNWHEKGDLRRERTWQTRMGERRNDLQRKRSDSQQWVPLQFPIFLFLLNVNALKVKYRRFS